MDRQRQIIAASGVSIGALTIITGILFWPKGEQNAGAQGAPGKPGQPGVANPRQKPGQTTQTPKVAGQPGAKPGQKAGVPGAATGSPGVAGQQAGKPSGAVPAGGIKGAAPGATGTTPKVVYKMPFKPRRDPTALIWKIPPPPPYVFNEVQVERFASYQVTAPPPPNTEIREVPSRRVSGIMSGDGVFAILEGEGGNIEIVKPGGETKDGYKVVSINADTVTLKKKEGNVTRTQIVPLSDIPPGQQTQMSSGGRFGGGPSGGPLGAGMSSPGGGGGGLGRPGRPGIGGGGGGGAASGKE